MTVRKVKQKNGLRMKSGIAKKKPFALMDIRITEKGFTRMIILSGTEFANS